MSNMWTRFLAGHWCHMILARQRRRTPSGQRCHPNCSDPLQPTAYSCLQPTAYSCLLLEIGRCVGVALPLSAQVRPHLPVVLEPVGRILIGLLACDMWRRYSRPGDDAHKLVCRWAGNGADGADRSDGADGADGHTGTPGTPGRRADGQTGRPADRQTGRRADGQKGRRSPEQIVAEATQSHHSVVQSRPGGWMWLPFAADHRGCSS